MRRSAKKNLENSQSTNTLHSQEDKEEEQSLGKANFGGFPSIVDKNIGQPPQQLFLVNEQDYQSPNFANLQNEEHMQQKQFYVHKLNSSAKYNINKGKVLTKLPGVFYRMVGEFLGEKLPLIIFTNRISFKVSLSHQIEFYEN